KGCCNKILSVSYQYPYLFFPLLPILHPSKIRKKFIASILVAFQFAAQNIQVSREDEGEWEGLF
ncbi:MAG TPA: hypothetical protein H9863_06255, partial [Candidatus Odoribacter faecigallinarum]|nr:hypothetical protein [Candidatus Odoribacter faecigallinarum]